MTNPNDHAIQTFNGSVQTLRGCLFSMLQITEVLPFRLCVSGCKMIIISVVQKNWKDIGFEKKLFTEQNRTNAFMVKTWFEQNLRWCSNNLSWFHMEPIMSDELWCKSIYGAFVCLCVCDRTAVITVDRHTGRILEEYSPQKKSRLYGITAAYAQCPSGNIPTFPHPIYLAQECPCTLH